MDGTGDSRGGRRRIGDAAKAAFLEAFRGGASPRDAAAAGGFVLNSFYRAARRDPDFRAQWDAAANRLHGETRIAPNNRRGLQVRRLRQVKFDAGRQQAFLAHFAGSCDTIAAAEAVGVCERTIYNHRRCDPAFAAEYDVALDQGYVRLEAEALRQRLAAQRALRAAIESGPPRNGEGDQPQAGGGGGVRDAAPFGIVPGGGPPASALRAATSPPRGGSLAADVAAEFERVMKLLDRRDRKARRPEAQASPGSPRQVWTFDAAIALLDKRLKALGLAVPPLPPEAAARYDGLPGGDEDKGE